MYKLAQYINSIKIYANHHPNLTEEERLILEQMTKKIVRKLLRLPMMKLNSSVGTNEENFYAEAMRALFRE